MPEYFFSDTASFIQHSEKNVTFPKQTKHVPSRKTATNTGQAPSKLSSQGKAQSQFLWLHNAMPYCVGNPELLEPAIHGFEVQTLCDTEAYATTGIGVTLVFKAHSEKALINCSCFLWCMFRSCADIHCRIEIRFNSPSIFSLEKQAHFRCVTASAVNIFNNINYRLQHLHDLEKHTVSWRQSLLKVRE